MPGSGIPTGVPPNAFTVSPMNRPATRIFSPFQSSNVLIGLLTVCTIAASVVWMLTIRIPLNSVSFSHFSANSIT